MSINFAAANMAGYNNPELKMIPAEINMETFELVNPLSISIMTQKL